MRAAFYTAPPQREVALPFDQPSPVQGIDGTIPIHNMPPQVAVFLYNILPSEYGCRTREGYRVWAEDIGSGSPINSLLPFLGQLGSAASSRLFAVGKAGIYDVTSLGTTNPVQEVVFGTQTDDAGFCSYIHFTDPNARQVMLVADSENGLYEYDPAGAQEWTKYFSEIGFPDSTTPSDIAFITTHKGRIWLIARGSADAYYLPVGAKNGQASKFQFGSKMEHGGYLVSLINWSIDGGDGLDDYLVAQGSGGDVLVYQGTDPSQADRWNLVGRWFVGSPPKQRRNGRQVGGDTILLSTFGVTSVSALLKGIDPTRVERNVTGKITRLIRGALAEKSDLNYWQVNVLPEDGLLIINSPKATNERHIQYVLNLNRVSEDSGGGWGLWRDVPANVFESHNKQIYFGTPDGRVCVMQGSLDEVTIGGLEGTPVDFSLMTGFSHLGAPGVFKQVQFSRPHFIASDALAVTTKVVYDYDLRELSLLPEQVGGGGYRWDLALWDKALWSGAFSAYQLSGGSGYGRQAAFYIQGQAFSRSTLANIEGTYTPWKFL